ncbi:MAG TPA: hypothetical protein VFV66_33855 [Nonomuraea sp.]|nr:hypothetical protein [Nonomuraea sp.]
MTERKKRRPYSSALRREHAQATQQRIATAARELMIRSAAAASPADAGLQDVLAGIERERLAGSRGPAEHLHALGALRPGLPPARAAAHIYVLTSTENFEKLTDVCQWSDAEYEEWLAAMLAAALLEPPHPESRR